MLPFQKIEQVWEYVRVLESKIQELIKRVEYLENHNCGCNSVAEELNEIRRNPNENENYSVEL